MNLSFSALLKGSASLLLALPLAAGAVVSRPATPFTDAELDQMLAPIALYPDAVLSHVLIAATVPDDVEDAAAWSRRHRELKGQAAVDAVERKDWDPSVKALVAFPDVLARMDDDPEWTRDLGEAFLDQEADVMDRVQYLRDRADAQGSLDEVEHVRVVREREYIYIEPAVSSVVYVPYYDPWVVYGSWWWPYYPPHHWLFWGGHPVHHYHGVAFHWGFGFHLGPNYYYPRVSWRGRHVVTTRPHRHYRPAPGYSGRSDVRHRRTEGRSHRAPRPGWRHDTRSTRRDDSPQRMRTRRSYDEVRQGLATRRESRAPGGSQLRTERGGSVQRESPRMRREARVLENRDSPRLPRARRDAAETRSSGRPPREIRDNDGGGELRRGGGREFRQGWERREETLRQGRGSAGQGRKER